MTLDIFQESAGVAYKKETSPQKKKLKMAEESNDNEKNPPGSRFEVKPGS